MSTFFMQVLAQAPMILIAAIFAAVGWRKLQHAHRRAAVWLLAGTGGLVLHALFDALRFVLVVDLNKDLRSGQIDIESVSSQMALTGIGSILLLLLSVACIAMSAISSRGPVEPKGAA
jgi:hypothetical protein